jgi:hypothetical protein
MLSKFVLICLLTLLFPSSFASYLGSTDLMKLKHIEEHLAASDHEARMQTGKKEHRNLRTPLSSKPPHRRHLSASEHRLKGSEPPGNRHLIKKTKNPRHRYLVDASNPSDRRALIRSKPPGRRELMNAKHPIHRKLVRTHPPGRK